MRLDDLVANGTITADGADLLREIGAHGHAFLVHALPRSAGKTTVTNAILAEAPADLARHEFLGTEEEATALAAQTADGYLVVAEMGHRGRPGYLAGEEIVRAFQLAAHGYALASSLHADTVDEVVALYANNGVDATTLASAVRYLVHVRVHGDPFEASTPRTVEVVHELSTDEGFTATPRYVRSG